MPLVGAPGHRVSIADSTMMVACCEVSIGVPGILVYITSGLLNVIGVNPA